MGSFIKRFPVVTLGTLVGAATLGLGLALQNHLIPERYAAVAGVVLAVLTWLGTRMAHGAATPLAAPRSVTRVPLVPVTASWPIPGQPDGPERP